MGEAWEQGYVHISGDRRPNRMHGKAEMMLGTQTMVDN